MHARSIVRCGILAAVLTLGFAAPSQAGNLVNEAKFTLEVKVVVFHPTIGAIWWEPFHIPSGYMQPLADQYEGCPLHAIWRPAGTAGDGGWSYMTGLPAGQTGYVCDYLTVSFR